MYQQPTLDNESFVVAISPMSPIIALPVYLAFMSVCQLLLMVLLSLNKPKGLKVAKEELRSIGSMVDRLNG